MPTTANLSLPYSTPLDPATADLWGDILNDIIVAYDGEFGTKTINQNFADKVLSRPVFKDYGETLATVSSSSGTATFNFENGNHQQITLTENTTFAFSNPPASGIVGAMMLYVTQNGTGGYTVTWPSAVKFSGATPVQTTTANRTDEYLIITRNAGTKYSGSVRNKDLNLT